HQLTASKWNVVVGQRLGRLRHRSARVHANLLALDRLAAPAAASAAEQHDTVAADFSGIALVPVLVVPLPRLQPPFDVDLLPLDEVLGERFGGLAPKHHAVPFGLFLPLARLVVPDLGSGHVDGCDGSTAGCVAQLGIASEVTDENHFVHAAHTRL